jgi:hypothetical protein
MFYVYSPVYSLSMSHGLMKTWREWLTRQLSIQGEHDQNNHAHIQLMTADHTRCTQFLALFSFYETKMGKVQSKFFFEKMQLYKSYISKPLFPDPRTNWNGSNLDPLKGVDHYIIIYFPIVKNKQHIYMNIFIFDEHKICTSWSGVHLAKMLFFSLPLYTCKCWALFTSKKRMVLSQLSSYTVKIWWSHIYCTGFFNTPHRIITRVALIVTVLTVFYAYSPL